MIAIEEALNLANMNAEWTYSDSADAWTLSIVTAVTNPEIEDEQGVSVCVPGAAGYSEQQNQTADSTYAAEGYINVACGNRGKQSTLSDGTFTGDAPSCLVDQKNAVRFVKYNILLGNLPGSVDYFVSTGGSGGGAHATMLAAYQADIAEVEAGDIYGNNIVELYDPTRYVGAEGTNNPTWARILMGASEGDISMFNSLNMQIAWLNAGTDAVIEWQWNGATFSLADVVAYRTAGASKAIPGFDVMDYGQEDYVFGSPTADARHWDRHVLDVLEAHQDVLADLFN